MEGQIFFQILVQQFSDLAYQWNPNGTVPVDAMVKQCVFQRKKLMSAGVFLERLLLKRWLV